MTGITLLYDNQQLFLYCILKIQLFLIERDIPWLTRLTTDTVYKPAEVSTAVCLQAA